MRSAHLLKSSSRMTHHKRVVQTFLRGQAPCRLLRAASGPPPALRAPTRHPPGVSLRCTPRASRSPAYRGPQRGPDGAPWRSTIAQAKSRPNRYTTAARSSRKARPPPAISTSRPGALPSPIPPAPSRWEGERVALCRQACRPRGASLASPAPCRGSVGTFQGRQGFASPSGVARVLAFGCGPLQPPLRPLTPFPLENPKPRRTESRHAAVPVH